MPWYTGRTCSSTSSAFQPRTSLPRGPFRLPVQTVLRDGRRLPRPRRHRRVRLRQRRRPHHRRAERPERARAAHRHDGPRSRAGQAGPGRRHPARHRYRRRARRRALARPTTCRPSPRSSRRASSGSGRRRSIRRRLFPAHGDRPRSHLEPRDPVAARPGDAGCPAVGKVRRQRHRHRLDRAWARPVAVDTFADNQPTGAS